MRRLLVAAVVLTGVVTAMSAAPAGACSMTPPTGGFLGQLESKDDGVATYRVERSLFGETPAEGRTQRVAYGGDAGYLEVDRSYRVSYYGDPGPGVVHSGVHTGGETCGGGGTVNGDGSGIETEISRVHLAIGAAAVALGFGLLVRSSRARTRRRWADHRVVSA